MFVGECADTKSCSRPVGEWLGMLMVESTSNMIEWAI